MLAGRGVFLVLVVAGSDLGSPWSKLHVDESTEGPIAMDRNIQLDPGLSWMDNFDLPLRSAIQLAAYTSATDIPRKCWYYNSIRQCIQIKEWYLRILPATLISNLIYCKTICTVQTEDFTLPWTIQSNAMQDKEQWIFPLRHFFKVKALLPLAGKKTSSFNVTFGPCTSKYMWLKPIIMYAWGMYNSTHSRENYGFHLNIPLVDKKGNLNGIVGRGDICLGDDALLPFHTKPNSKEKIKDMKEFSCQ
ncbi:hypothetical protein DSO57_1028998 [Entomophthora muscae]|uniref:Uncharacterized protein n=1 Tax=Entomophthora muscae TaxID=34485 RepID=A0ACC2SQS9_9FUNG|nr:hypothetical protein DSO57_1028998 [Entomophthora muscae]